MRHRLCILLLLVLTKAFSQSAPSASLTAEELKPGDKAPSFLLTLQGNSIQSFAMPYLNRIVLLHFWSSTVSRSKVYNKFLNRLAGRYKNALYRKAEGFEVIAVAVQSDKTAWMNTIKNDTLSNFINGIAPRGYIDELCKKFNVTSVPKDILIDENGIILAINPHIRTIEDILDERKNFMPVKKDVIGTLALASNAADFLRFGKLYLFDAYGDSIAQTVTGANGAFTFSDIKLNQDFILKVDNQSDIITSDPLTLYTYKGAKLLEGKTFEGGFIFYIPSKMSYMLTEDADHTTLSGSIGQINVIKDLVFGKDGAELTAKDERDLNSIVSILLKNKSLSVEVSTHTDLTLDDKEALELTARQASTVKNFFVKKGISAARVKTVPRGNTQVRVQCTECSNEDHKQNRRVEFVVYKS